MHAVYDVTLYMCHLLVEREEDIWDSTHYEASAIYRDLTWLGSASLAMASNPAIAF